MTAKEVLEEIKKSGSETIKKVHLKHGAKEPFYGVKIEDLNKEAIETGKKIGNVEVDMNGTSCKVPFAPDYIKKVLDKGYLGKKKKTVKC